jgi:TolA-binding protein
MDGLNNDNVGGQVSQPQSTPEVSQPQSSDRFAILARKEKAMRDRVRQIEEQERSFKQKEQELQSSYISRDKLQKDPLAVLSELGLSYDKLTEQALNQQNPMESHVRSMREEIQALKGLIESQQKQNDEFKSSQYQNAIKQLKFDTDQLIESNSDFELIKSMGASDQVVDLIDSTFKETGRVMSVQEAAKTVEDYLFQNALNVAKLGKISKALLPQEPTPQEPQAGVPQKPAPTLTHSQTTGASKPMSEKDRVARAIAAFSTPKR